MLPDEFQTDINPSKLSGYLLNTNHPDGWGKAKFFHGHNINTEEQLKALLLLIIASNNITKTIQTEFGTKYIVEGSVSHYPEVVLRTVWVVLKAEKICKFVTAYPL